ncbi:MAG: hypothetical protein Q8S57_08910 [Methanoregula sp.]|nr:hypothetical protein [Methanoregula sp.]
MLSSGDWPDILGYFKNHRGKTSNKAGQTGRKGGIQARIEPGWEQVYEDAKRVVYFIIDSMKNSSGMFLIFLCIMLILAAGCTSPATTNTAPVAVRTPIPTAAAQQEPVRQETVASDSSAPEKKYKSSTGTSEHLKISGANDENRGFFVTVEEGYTITASYPKTGVFIVHITDSSGKNEEYVFNEMGSGSCTGRKIVKLPKVNISLR